MVIKIKIITFTLLIFIQSIGFAKTIKTQQQFDEIIDKILIGDTISVKLNKGIYRLSKPISTKAPLTIKGNNASIISYTDVYSLNDAINETPSHYVCRLKTPLNEFSLIVDNGGQIIAISESVDTATLVNTTPFIDGTDGTKIGSELKISIPTYLTQLKNKTFSKAFGYFDCGWADIKFKIKYSDNDYFYCETLNTTNVPNFNYEKKAYSNDIRFVIYNAEIKENTVYYDTDYIYIPHNFKQLYVKNNNLFYISNSDITINSDVRLSGVTFDGIEGIAINSAASSTCEITNCTFRQTLGMGVYISKKYNQSLIPVRIKNCRFEECSILKGNALSLNGSFGNDPNVYVSNCKFVRYPNAVVRYKNTSSMVYVNTNAQLKNCRLWNTSRCHLYFSSGNSSVIQSIIYNTPEFNLAKERNLSNDWGLIYVDHLYRNPEKAIANKTNKVSIDGCFLHGAYAHANDARGVMIDDGRGYVTCRNNVVADCQCFSLDSRDAKSFISTSSIRNRFENNILCSRYRLAGGIGLSTKDYPATSRNIIIGDFKNILNDKLIIENADIQISGDSKIKDDGIYLCRKSYNHLKDLGFINEKTGPYIHRLN